MMSKLVNVQISIAVLAIGMSGCSGEFASAGADDGAETNGPAAESTDGADASDEDAGGTTGGGAGLDESGDSPPDPDDSGGSEDVCDIDCGGGGSCEIDEFGAAYCSCTEGYVAIGLQCLLCEDTQGAITVDIPMVGLTTSLTLNGGSFPASPYENAKIWLRDTESGDAVELGATRDGDIVEAIPVIPGNYEVYYEHIAGDTVVPANTSARLDTVRIPQGSDFDLELDITAIELSGNITFNGQAAPESQYENGTILLRHRGSGDEIELADTRERQYSALVLPGTYDIHYRARLASTTAPINKNALLGEMTVGDLGDDSPLVHNIDVDVTVVSGSFSIDDNVPSTSPYENGLVLLRDQTTGDETLLGETRHGEYSVPVVSGSYDVIYRRLLGGDLVPVNRGAVIGEVGLEDPTQGFNINMETAVVTGAITLNGAMPPTVPTNDGLLVLRGLEGDDEAVLGHTNEGAYSRRVLRGSYDVYYRVEASTGIAPVNSNARLENITVNGGANFDINIPTVAANASVTLNGILPPQSAYDDGLLYLRNRADDDSVLLGATRMGTLAQPVIPGSYDIVYAVEAAGPTVPVNAESTVDAVDLGATPTFEIDIPVAVLGGPVTVASEAPPMGPYNGTDLWLRDLETEDAIYVGILDSGQFAQPLTAGTYLLSYHNRLSTGAVPVNEGAVLGCYRLTP